MRVSGDIQIGLQCTFAQTRTVIAAHICFWKQPTRMDEIRASLVASLHPSNVRTPQPQDGLYAYSIPHPESRQLLLCQLGEKLMKRNR